jgi:hypothetical protein
MLIPVALRILNLKNAFHFSVFIFGFIFNNSLEEILFQPIPLDRKPEKL